MKTSISPASTPSRYHVFPFSQDRCCRYFANLHRRIAPPQPSFALSLRSPSWYAWLSAFINVAQSQVGTSATVSSYRREPLWIPDGCPSLRSLHFRLSISTALFFADIHCDQHVCHPPDVHSRLPRRLPRRSVLLHESRIGAHETRCKHFAFSQCQLYNMSIRCPSALFCIYPRHRDRFKWSKVSTTTEFCKRVLSLLTLNSTSFFSRFASILFQSSLPLPSK